MSSGIEIGRSKSFKDLLHDFSGQLTWDCEFNVVDVLLNMANLHAAVRALGFDSGGVDHKYDDLTATDSKGSMLKFSGVILSGGKVEAGNRGGQSLEAIAAVCAG